MHSHLPSTLPALRENHALCVHCKAIHVAGEKGGILETNLMLGIGR